MGVVAQHETVIDGFAYSCRTFTASEGLVLLPKLIAMLGDDVAKLIFATSEAQQAKIFSDPGLLAGVLVQVSTRAAENDGLLIVRDCFKHAKCSNSKIGEAEAEVDLGKIHFFDQHFAGRYAHLLAVFSWIVRASFGSP
jgi:hypothetical protein